ncbi:unnamed protein product [Sympodiomycopsis kandeliae]
MAPAATEPSGSSSPASSSSGAPKASSNWKQSVLAFKPRLSSNLAGSSSSTSAQNDHVDASSETESMMGTPPLLSNANDPMTIDDESPFGTPPPPPRKQMNGDDTANTSAYITVDDSDDDLSDPPPINTASGSVKAKVLTKKRPSSAGQPNGTSSKRPKKDGPRGKYPARTEARPGQDSAPRKPMAPGENPHLCHHHRTLCPDDLIRCTHLRKSGAQCPLKYCARSLSTIYKISREDILAKGRKVTDDIDPTVHVHAREAPYFFMCPRCAGTCNCSVCRKKNGLPPLGPAKAARVPKDKPEPSTATASSPANSKSKVKATSSAKKEAQPKEKATKSAKQESSKKAKTEDAGTKGKGKQAAKPAKEAKSIFKTGAKDKSAESSVLNGWKAARQTSLPRPLRAPKPVAAPQLEVIPTKLHRDNFEARVWIYETLVRFEFIKLPKATLSQLDKFDLWTHRQVQMVLERVLIAIGGVHSIQSGVPKAGTTESIKAYRKFGEDLTRGEPWMAAKKLCEVSHVEVPTLSHVDRIFEDESKDAPVADNGPTLLGSRSTRARRAAEVKALERVKLQSLADFDGGMDSESDYSDSAPRGRGQRARRNVSYGDADNTEDDDDDEEDEAPRRSGRQTARQAAVTEAKAIAEGARRSGRTQRSLAISTPSEADADESEDANRSARSSTAPDTGAHKGDSEVASLARSETPVAVVPPAEAEPIAVPEMEEKVAIIAALLEIVMQKSETAEELKGAANRIPEIEKGCRDDLRDLEKEWDELKVSLNKGAPSISQAELFAKWKKDKEKKERDFKLQILDVKVNAYRELEANKIRTGPLGVDADGREFWQLTEFNEQMPANTGGRWSWCVLVHGDPMTKHAPPAGVMPNNAPSVSPLKASAASLDDPIEIKDEEDEDMKTKTEAKDDAPKTPSKADQASATDEFSTPARDVSADDKEAEESKPVFMGTNYPPSISEVISFLRYRYAQLDYEESKAQRDAETAASMNVSSSPGSPAVSRKAKKQLKEAQEARKRRVEELCDKLESCRRYYMWHYAEVDEGDVASTF